MRSSATLLKTYINDCHYAVETIYKPNAGFREVVGDIKNLVACTSDNHCVIIQAGSNDVLKGHRFDWDYISGVIHKLAHTNILFMSIPYWNGRPILNRLIYSYNCELYNVVRSCSSQMWGLLK